MAEKAQCATWDSDLVESRKRARLEQRAARVAEKLERMKQEEGNHRCRVLADRLRFELHEALLCVGHCPGERTYTDDWAFLAWL